MLIVLTSLEPRKLEAEVVDQGHQTQGFAFGCTFPFFRVQVLCVSLVPVTLPPSIPYRHFSFVISLYYHPWAVFMTYSFLIILCCHCAQTLKRIVGIEL